jgi:type I restriction enzyme M protein
VNKQIWSLIDTFRGIMPMVGFIEPFAACCTWLKLTEDSKLDGDHIYSGTATKEQLIKVLNDCVDVHFNSGTWKLSDEQLTQLMSSMHKLLTAKVISYHDLSLSINLMLENEGKRTGMFSIPEELCQLGVALLGGKVESVYCPYNNGSDFATRLPKSSKKYGESIDESDVFYAEIHNILLDDNFSIVNCDPIRSPYYIGDGGLKQFTSSVAIPPFGLKTSYKNINDIWDRFPEKSLMSEVYFLRHMLAQTTDMVVCFVANGFLFRTAAGEKQFKQDVLNHNWVKAVIALPNNLLPHTSIPISILILDKHKTGKTVNFIDASTGEFINKATRTRNQLINVDNIISAYNSIEDTQFSRHCSAEEIVKNDYNLSPNRYVFSEDEQKLNAFLLSHQTAQLADLVEIIRPQAVKHDESAENTFTEYNLSTLNEIGEISGEGKLIQVGINELNRADKQTIKPYDVLVVCKGAVGKIAIVGEHISENSIASQAFSILRIKPHISSVTSEALYQYLISDFGQLQLKGLTTGTSALMVSAKDLNTLQIPLFNGEELGKIKEVRHKVVEAHKQIETLNQDITSLNNSWL